MPYVQIIELQTTRFDEVEQLHEAWLAETDGTRTSLGEQVLRDRERPDTYLVIVQFPSFEAAQVNNDLPATAHFAEAMGKLVDGEPTFRNLDVVRTDS